MLSSLIDSVVRQPRIYDFIQRLAGREEVARHTRPWFANVRGRVLDIGGGTGRLREQLHRDVEYICVDVDPRPLSAFLTQRTDGKAVVANGTALPVKSRSIDAALIVAVFHHLDEKALDALCLEVNRVLAADGELIVLDAVLAPHRFMSRMLWFADRGSWPRRAEAIEAALRHVFDVVESKTFDVLHEYVLLRCRKTAV